MADLSDIKLGIYGDRAYQIIQSIHEVCSDKFLDGFAKSRVKRAIDGEVVLDRARCNWYGSVRSVTREKLGPILKKYLYTKGRGYGNGCGKNSADTVHLEVQCWNSVMKSVEFEVREFFCIYDVLCGHSIELLKRTYGASFVDKLVGQPLNPFLIEQEKLRAEELTKLDEERARRCDELREACRAKIAEVEAEIKARKEELNRTFDAQKTMFSQAE